MTLPTDIWVNGYNFTGAPNLNQMEDNLRLMWCKGYNNTWSADAGSVHTGNAGVTNSTSFYKFYNVTYQVTSQASAISPQHGEASVRVDPTGTNSWTKISGRRHQGQILSAPSSYNNVSFILPPNGKWQILSLADSGFVTVPYVFEATIDARHTKYTYAHREHVTSLTPLKTYFDDVNTLANTSVAGTATDASGASSITVNDLTFINPRLTSASSAANVVRINNQGQGTDDTGIITRNGGVWLVNKNGTVAFPGATPAAGSRRVTIGNKASVGTVTSGQTNLETQFINAQTSVKKACNTSETTTIGFDSSTSQTFTPSTTYPTILTTLVNLNPTVLAAATATLNVAGTGRASLNQVAGGAQSDASMSVYVRAGEQITLTLSNATFTSHYYWILDMGATA